jgi:flagellar protein FliJ
MSFRFPLQTVLHLRQSVEHQHELRLQAANQQVARVRQLLRRLDDHIREFRQQSSRELESGMSGAALRFALDLESVLAVRRRELEMELSRVSRIRDQQQRTFEQVRREREKFESLRQHAMRDYRIDRDRRDQRTLDELFLLQRAFRNRG